MADMPLSKLARDFAAEISYHDWSDAPFRADRAGHRREHDGRSASAFHLDATQTEKVRTNVMWVVAQVLGHHDPNLDIYRFAEARRRGHQHAVGPAPLGLYHRRVASRQHRPAWGPGPLPHLPCL